MINLKIKLKKRELAEVANALRTIYGQDANFDRLNVEVCAHFYNLRSLHGKLLQKYEKHFDKVPNKSVQLTLNINEYFSLWKFYCSNDAFFERSVNVYYRTKFQGLLDKMRKALTAAQHIQMANVS